MVFAKDVRKQLSQIIQKIAKGYTLKCTCAIHIFKPCSSLNHKYLFFADVDLVLFVVWVQSLI